MNKSESKCKVQLSTRVLICSSKILVIVISGDRQCILGKVIYSDHCSCYGFWYKVLTRCFTVFCLRTDSATVAYSNEVWVTVLPQ